MKNYYRVAASITAYEDIKAVESCLKAIDRQSYEIDAILIFDNSHVPMFHSVNSEIETLVKTCPENVGTAGAFKFQIAWAIEQKFDFLWVFDQDSEPEEDCLEKLIDCYEILVDRDVSTGIIAPVPIEPETNYELHGLNFNGYKFLPAKVDLDRESFYTCDAVIASGSLVSMQAAQVIDLPDADLFIDAVDWDYCLNLRRNNFEVVVVKNAFMRHKYASCSVAKLPMANYRILIHNYSPLRKYYICRNHTYISNKYASKYFLLRVYLDRALYLLKTTLKILFYEKHDKKSKLWASVLGTIDGFRGMLGKRWV